MFVGACSNLMALVTTDKAYTLHSNSMKEPLHYPS